MTIACIFPYYGKRLPNLRFLAKSILLNLANPQCGLPYYTFYNIFSNEEHRLAYMSCFLSAQFTFQIRTEANKVNYVVTSNYTIKRPLSFQPIKIELVKNSKSAQHLSTFSFDPIVRIK